MAAVVDTSVLIKFLTGDPPAQARAAGKLLAADLPLILTDVVIAECVYVLESFYRFEPDAITDRIRYIIEFEGVVVTSRGLIHRALDLYQAGHDFADAYIVAHAEDLRCDVASFDKGIDRIGTVRRIERVRPQK